MVIVQRKVGERAGGRHEGASRRQENTPPPRAAPKVHVRLCNVIVFGFGYVTVSINNYPRLAMHGEMAERSKAPD